MLEVQASSEKKKDEGKNQARVSKRGVWDRVGLCKAGEKERNFPSEGETERHGGGETRGKTSSLREENSPSACA